MNYLKGISLSYSAKYIDHFTNPRGIGEVDHYDAIAEVEHDSQGCFDRIKLTLLIEDNVIRDAKFKARACSGTIAACSALVECITDKKVEEARQLTPDDLANYLDGIPDKKRHSVELAINSLNKAISNILKSN